jgi:hypothetical protein
VGGRFGRGAHRGADAVTGSAVARCSFEYRIGVTQLALQVAMLADELEAGGEVIEAITLLLGRASARRRDQGDDQQ